MTSERRATHYEVLMVVPNAHDAVIKAAYRALAFQYHPDKNTSSADIAKMAAINDAWNVLSDHNKRAEYDLWIKDQEMIDAWKQVNPRSVIDASPDPGNLVPDRNTSVDDINSSTYKSINFIRSLVNYFSIPDHIFRQLLFSFVLLVFGILSYLLFRSNSDPLSALAVEVAENSLRSKLINEHHATVSGNANAPVLIIDYGENLHVKSKLLKR